MGAAKIAVTLDEDLLDRLDRLVAANQFASRSRAVQEAVREKLDRVDHTRLSQECAKLDPHFECDMAALGLTADVESWPEY